MKLITAIVRTAALEAIVKSLEDAGMKGMTISEVKGTGEQVQLYKPYTIHSKIEIFVSDDDVEKTSDIILDNTRCGIAGDGILAVTSVDHVVKIRTNERIE